MADTIDQDGQIVPANEDRAPAARDVDIGAMVSLARAEIDLQVATARRYPRVVSTVIKHITELATLDEETAEECCYALVRRKKGARKDDEENKPIEGPSIRLAEIAAQCYGNCRIDARVIAVNRLEKYVEAEGIFHDLESNMASRATVRRRISTSSGYLFSDDMIAVTSNAACAIAKRNAILAGIPRGVYRGGYKAARAVIAGTVMTLGENRAKVYKAFAAYGVTPAQIHELLGVGGEADVGLDHVALLRATFSSIKNGEANVSEIFAREKVGEGVADPLGPATTTAAPADKPADKPAETKAPGKDKAKKSKEPESGAGATTPAQDAGAAGAADPQASTAPATEAIKASTVAAESGWAKEAQSPTPGAEPAQAAAPAAPKVPANEAEYTKHVLAYCAAATSSAVLENDWRGERALRRAINITFEVQQPLEEAKNAKIAELKGAGK